jgi:phospholipid N-methyltransferase
MSYSGALAVLRAELGKAGRRGAGLSYWASIGAVCESSHWLAQRMKDAIRDPSLPVVELGAGYGSLTRVLPENTVSIERDAKRYEHLRATFPERTILDSDAMLVLAQLSAPTVVVSSIPNINNPEFGRLSAAFARAHKAGMIAELVTYTYFPHNPLPGIFAKSERFGLELLNIPPAFVWRYSC